MKSQVVHTVWCYIIGENCRRNFKLITLGSARVNSVASSAHKHKRVGLKALPWLPEMLGVHGEISWNWFCTPFCYSMKPFSIWNSRAIDWPNSWASYCYQNTIMLIMIVYYWLGYTPLHTGAWCNVGHLISCHTTFIILVMYLRREKYGTPNLMQTFCLAVSPGDPEVSNNGSKRLRLYKCERCAMKFMGLALLRQHCREVHGDQKYYKCGVCGKLFSHPSSRNIHLRLHSGEKPYECETCGKRFRVSSHLKDHIRVHTGGFCVCVGQYYMWCIREMWTTTHPGPPTRTQFP